MKKTLMFPATLMIGFMALGGSVSADNADTKTPLSGFERTGETVNCLETYQIEQTNILDDKRIVFETTGGNYYLNELPYKCSQLGFEERFTYTLRGIHRLCNVDTITVLTSSGPGATCGLGKFEKLTKKPEK